MKPLSAKPHGILDYAVGLFLLLSPWIFGFNSVSTVATLTMVVVSIVVFALSMITDYPMGVLKLVPFPTHGVIETIGALFLGGSPWLVGFFDVVPARNIALIVAVAWLGVIALTNYSTSESHRPAH